MKSICARRLGSVAIVIAIGAITLAHGETAPQPAAFIQSVDGAVYLRQAGDDTKSRGRLLDPKKDAGLILNVGENIHCEAHGAARIHTTARTAEFAPDVCKPGKDFVIPDPHYKRSESAGLGDAPETIAALEIYGRRAGRSKGTECPIYSPPDGGAIIPSQFVIRWRTRPPLSKISIILRSSAGAELRRVDNVDGAIGMLDSDAFRTTLITYGDTAGLNHVARLAFRSESDHEDVVEFSVLTREQQESVEKSLNHINASHGLFRHVERAATFEEAHMYDMVAAEYNAALEEAPQSRDMLRAAYYAHIRTGDLLRARELRDLLLAVESQTETRE